jgi:hypothetical protein
LKKGSTNRASRINSRQIESTRLEDIFKKSTTEQGTDEEDGFQSGNFMTPNGQTRSINEKIMLTEDCLINDLDNIGDKISEIEELM